MPNDFSDFLRVEGIHAKGFGFIGKLAMRDSRLTVEAKAVYAYFCSYAGAGSIAFPKVETIIKDLQISKDRYYRHFKLLAKYDYIRVVQEKVKSGRFARNVYTLISNPCPQNKEAAPYPCFPETGLPYTADQATKKIKGEKEQLEKEQENQSVCPAKTLDANLYDSTGRKRVTDRTEFDLKTYAFIKQQIRLADFAKEDQEILETAITGLITGDFDGKKPRPVVLSILEKLDYWAVERALQNYRKNSPELIKKPIIYFQQCLLTSGTEEKLEVSRFQARYLKPN